MNSPSNIVEREEEAVDAPALQPAVSAVLWLWDSLNLEVGEVALVTDGHPWSRLAALAATWYGALPVLFIGETLTDVPSGVTFVHSTGSETEARDLAAMVRQRPRVAAAELSGTSAMVDLLLEALPPQSRVMFAGQARQRLTIDYYLNVHIKGIRVVSGILDAGEAAARSPEREARARRLLARPAFAAACRAAMGIKSVTA